MAEVDLHEYKNEISQDQIEGKGTAGGIDTDEAVLSAQGHKAQLQRSFSWMGALGLAFRFVLLWPFILLRTSLISITAS